MKKVFLITGLVIMSLMVVLGGCSVDKVSPPASEVYSGIPATVRVTLSSSTVGSGGSATVTATVTEADTAPCPNISVTFSVISAASGSFSTATAVTDATGMATVQFTAANVNATATIRATATYEATTVNGSTTLTIGTPVPVPTSVVISLSPTSLPAAGGSVTATATVTDASGPLSGVTVMFSTSNGSAGSLSATSATTSSTGNAAVTYTANAGNLLVDIRVSAGTLSNSASLQIGTPPPPTPASVAVAVTPLSIAIANQGTVSVTVRDSSGAPAFQNAVSLTITSGTTLASFNSGTTQLVKNLTTDAAGVASATIYSGTSSGAVTVSATAGVLSPVSASFYITSDPASISMIVVNPSLINGQTTNITANVRNFMNSAVSDGTVVNFAITSFPPYPGALSASAASTVNGVASVTFTADATSTGSAIIQASAGTLLPAQQIVIVNPAQAGSIEFESATPSIINIKGAGASDSVVMFKVMSSAGAPLANQSVNFQLTGPFGATLDTSGGTASSGSTDADGKVTTIVHAGYVAGPINILASTTIAGPPVSILYAGSGNISIGGGVPSYKWFSISVTKFNIAGWNCDNVNTTINVNMADRFGNYNILQGTSVSFATPFGAIDTSNITNEMGQTQSVFRSQDPRPANGQVRILVQATGEENFTDMNANGIYDAGTDVFIGTDDLPEPYIDTNADGAHTAGEVYFNWPAGITGATNGYNAANGVWDDSIPIWKTMDIWLTGPPDMTNSKVVCCNPAVNAGHCASGAAVSTAITLANGSSTVCYVFAADVNNNPLVSGTKVSLESDNPDATTKVYSGTNTLGDIPGPGAAIVSFTVTNKTASVTPVSANLSASLEWPGACGAVKTAVSYPATVTLSP